MNSADAWNPATYHLFQKERSTPFFDLMSLVQPAPFENVIDLGCGTGELTQALHQTLKPKNTLGIDSSGAMLKQANTFAGGGLSFEAQNISQFEASQSYDLVFSNAALHWCPDHPTLFAKFFAALKPGGQLAIQVPANHDYPTHTIAQALVKEEPFAAELAQKPAHASNAVLTIEAYAKLLFDLGFQQQQVRLQLYAHVLPSSEGVLDWVKGTTLTAFQSSLSPQTYEQFLATYKKRLLATLSGQKPFLYPFKRILIWARR